VIKFRQIALASTSGPIEEKSSHNVRSSDLSRLLGKCYIRPEPFRYVGVGGDAGAQDCPKFAKTIHLLSGGAAALS
jgi:hypothetical protein